VIFWSPSDLDLIYINLFARLIAFLFFKSNEILFFIKYLRVFFRNFLVLECFAII